jgi:hypothetical protein
MGEESDWRGEGMGREEGGEIIVETRFLKKWKGIEFKSMESRWIDWSQERSIDIRRKVKK